MQQHLDYEKIVLGMDFTWMIMCIVWIFQCIFLKMEIDRAESDECFLARRVRRRKLEKV